VEAEMPSLNGHGKRIEHHSLWLEGGESQVTKMRNVRGDWYRKENEFASVTAAAMQFRENRVWSIYHLSDCSTLFKIQNHNALSCAVRCFPVLFASFLC
jgi:hypothetical protein